MSSVNIFFQENAFESTVCKMPDILLIDINVLVDRGLGWD